MACIGRLLCDWMNKQYPEGWREDGKMQIIDSRTVYYQCIVLEDFAIEYELRYEDGSAVSMLQSGLPCDTIKLLRKHGSTNSAMSIQSSKIVLDSTSSCSPLTQHIHARASETLDNTMEVLVKISTNITSCQHYGRKFSMTCWAVVPPRMWLLWRT